MSRQPRPCEHCGQPIQPKAKGRPAKVHPECRAEHRAARARERRREQDPEVGSPERLERRMAGNEERLLRREHKHVRKDLDFLGLMGAPDGEPRGPKPGAPEDGVAWEDGKLVQIHFDKYADIIPPSAWRRLVYKAAAAVSAATADVARSFIAVWQEEDRSTAQRHLEETIEEPEIAAPYFGTEPIGRRAE